MPRPNYVLIWNQLKDMLVTLHSQHVDAIAPTSLLRLMVILENQPIDWSNLDEILQHLKAPTRH